MIKFGNRRYISVTTDLSTWMDESLALREFIVGTANINLLNEEVILDIKSDMVIVSRAIIGHVNTDQYLLRDEDALDYNEISKVDTLSYDLAPSRVLINSADSCRSYQLLSEG